MDDLTGQIIGAAIEVHHELGVGLLECVYEAALCHELDLRGIAYQRQVAVDISYKGVVIQGQRLDTGAWRSDCRVKSAIETARVCTGTIDFIFKINRLKARPVD